MENGLEEGEMVAGKYGRILSDNPVKRWYMLELGFGIRDEMARRCIRNSRGVEMARLAN